MSYGRSVAAKVSVGRNPNVGLMRPHTPLAPMAPANAHSNVSHVHVGGDACGTCGVPSGPSFNDAQRQMWASSCGPGEKRRPLGTTRAVVAAGASQAFTFASIVPYKVLFLMIDDQIASDFTVMSIQIGMQQIVLGGELPAAMFNTRNGWDCKDMFEACTIFPSIPAIVTVRNDAAEDLYFSAAFNGNALLAC